MHRFAVQFVLLVSVACAMLGCARRWGRTELATLDPLISDKSESATPVTSKYASAQNPTEGAKGEGEKSPASTAETDKDESPASAKVASKAAEKLNEKPGERSAREDKTKIASTTFSKAGDAEKTTSGKTPEKLSPAGQQELEKTLAAAGSDISPLARQQLIAILEYSRQKDDSQRDADAVVVSPVDSPIAAAYAESAKKGAAQSPAANSTAATSTPVVREAPATNTPHVTVNVTTAAPVAPDLTLLQAKEKEALVVRNLPSNAPPTSGREVPRNSVDVPSLLASNATNGSPSSRTEAVADKMVSPASATTPASAGTGAASVADDNKNSKPPVRKGQWRESLIQAIDALDAELRTDGIAPRGDEKTRLAAFHRLLNLVAERREDAVREIDSLDKQQKEYWKKQVLALAVVLDAEGIPAEGRRSALALRHLREAANHLAVESTLDVRGLAFCSKVDGYGVYNEFPKNEFKNDQEVLLYVEIDNFAVEEKSASRKSPSYETELRGTYEIYDAAGHRVSDFELPLDKQTCRNHRRDYFIAYRMYIPKRIDPGQYTLRLSVEDMKGRKHGQASIEFAIKP